MKKQTKEKIEEVKETKIEEKVEEVETKNEETETAKVEETETVKTEENITPIDIKQVNIYEVDTNVNLDDFEKLVEEKRNDIQLTYKHAKRNSNIMTLIMVLLVVASIILISQKPQVFKIIGYVVGGVSLVGMLIFYIVNRNKMPDKMKNYIVTIGQLFNAYLYKNPRFTNLSCNPDEKLDQGEIESDGVYTNVKALGSRNVLRGLFLERTFLVSDVKMVTTEGKKDRDLFVGKYLSYPNDNKFDGRVVVNVCLKGPKVYDLPNAVSDLQEVEHKDEFTIWATPGLDYKKIINADLINKLNKIVVKEERHLYNVNLVVWGGHTAMYLSYDDKVMTFPFEEEFKKAGIDAFKKDQEIVFDIFEALKKERTVKNTVPVKKVEDEPAQTETKEAEPEVKEDKKEEEKEGK